MPEAKTKFEYELINDEGHSVAITPELEMDAHEKDRGAVGMLEQCKRIMNRMGQWGYLPSGCVTASKVKVSFMIYEENDGGWNTLIDMSFIMSDDGFVKINGKFPIVIIQNTGLWDLLKYPEFSPVPTGNTDLEVTLP